LDGSIPNGMEIPFLVQTQNWTWLW
jgi:hypothetical protein